MRISFLYILVIVAVSCKKTTKEYEYPWKPPLQLDGSEEQLKKIKAPVGPTEELGSCHWYFGLPVQTIEVPHFFTSHRFYFYYQSGTSYFSSIERRHSPYYYSWECAGWQNMYYCNGEGRMDSAIETICGGTIGDYVRKTHHYNYYPSGALKSVILSSKFLIQERFFSYNTQGQVDMMLWSGRDPSVKQYRFLEQHFKYDSAGNVIELTCRHPDSETLNEIYTFTYDDNPNIWKGIFFPTYRTWIPDYHIFCASMLSNNNVTYYSEHMLSNNTHRESFFTFEYENRKLKKLNTLQDTFFFEY